MYMNVWLGVIIQLTLIGIVLVVLAFGQPDAVISCRCEVHIA